MNGEYTRFHVGFRRLEIATVKDGDRDVKAFLVNGQSVKFKGVNFHEHNPYTGHYTNRENLLEDLKLMKLANINAIRTCHYPQQREFYELCDSLGFYVYDEANIESHGMGYRKDRTLGNKPEWYTMHLDRTLNMYRRTANYPCVTILSLGNEAGNGVNFYNTYKELKELEKDGQNRPVVYERAEYDWNTDIINPMYPGADWFKRMGETYDKRPVIPCEYAHAMGNSTGSLDWQWEHIYAHTHLQGGFIWDWVDQGLYDEEKGWTYGGDYGENAPSDANFLCNGLVNPDRDPHPGYYEVKHVYQDMAISAVDAEKGLFSIFNRHYFTDLSPYTVLWRVERDGKQVRKGKLHFATPPQTAEEFQVKLPRMKKAGAYRILFEVVASQNLPLIDKGAVLAMDEILLKDNTQRKAFQARGTVSVTEEAATITLKARKASVVFDKAEGIVRSYTFKGKDLIDPAFGLKPNFWRAPTDNDYGNGWAKRTQAWKQASRTLESTVSVEEGEHAATLHVVYSLPEGTSLRVDYTLLGNGVLKVENAFTGSGKKSRVEIPRLGFRFHVADDAFRFYGRGPVENYWDRNSGTFKSIWKSTASAEYYPYVRPQETGHHTETSWLETGPVTVAGDFEFNALRQTVEDLDGEEATQRPYQWNSWGSRTEPLRVLWPDQDYSYSFLLAPTRMMKGEKLMLYAQ